MSPRNLNVCAAPTSFILPATVFRDSFVALVKDLTSVAEFEAVLFQSVDELDYKKYADPLFELVIVGCLVQPGGILSKDPALRNQFSLFDIKPGDWDSLRERVEIINKLVRRYKYLQLKLDDTLSHLLQYINKYEGGLTSNLANACGVMFSLQVASIPILTGLFKDHLVKDGTFISHLTRAGSSLDFVTTVFQSYLKDQSSDHLLTQLKKSGVGSRLMDFFPPSKRTSDFLISHFSEHGLKTLAEHHLGNVQRNMVDATRAYLVEMFKENAPVEQVIEYSKSELAKNSWTESELLPILWESFMDGVEWAGKSEQMEVQMAKELATWAAVFAPFCKLAKSEIYLLLQIQVQCYEDARLMKIFSKIVQHLYKHDILSENAICYWFEKASGAQGRNIFLKQMNPFVDWLKVVEE
ncbi:MAG: hypothetical protein SGCHY_000296 [Lobulomycetales sp.]